MVRSSSKRIVPVMVVALVTLVLDQVTKAWARGTLRGERGITLVEGYLDLQYHENSGMAFGLARDLPGGRYILVGVGLAVLWLVWRMVRQMHTHPRLAGIAFGLIAGGAIGNIIDRIMMGRVVDFVLMHWRRHYWPAYNIADVALCVGVGLMILAMRERRSETGGKSPSARGGKR